MPHALFIIETCQQISDNRLDARVTCRRAHIRKNPQSFHRSERRRAAPARVTLQTGSESSVVVLELCQFRRHSIAAAVCEIKSEQSALKRSGSLVNKHPSLGECLVAERCWLFMWSATFGDAAQQRCLQHPRAL